MPRGRQPEPPEPRFLRHTQHLGECWIWTGYLTPQGYGMFRIGRWHGAAHRWAYEHWKGPIPAYQILRHTCDVRSCVNPEHLLAGYDSDNAGDRMRRGPSLCPTCRRPWKRDDGTTTAGPRLGPTHCPTCARTWAQPR